MALFFLDHGTRKVWGSTSRPGHSLPPGKTRYPLYRRLGGPQVGPGQVWKTSPLTGIRSPDRPARSQSLYRLGYPAHKCPRWDSNPTISARDRQQIYALDRAAPGTGATN